jgi:hypothetical protein
VSDMPKRKILATRTEMDLWGRFTKIATLECGHEIIPQPDETERECVACEDEARFGSPAPRPPRES